MFTIILYWLGNVQVLKYYSDNKTKLETLAKNRENSVINNAYKEGGHVYVTETLNLKQLLNPLPENFDNIEDDDILTVVNPDKLGNPGTISVKEFLDNH